MIDAAIVLLRDLLNEHLRSRTADTDGSTEDEVVLIDGDRLDPVSFKSGAVTALLVNVESDNSTRPADPFRRSLPNGSQIVVPPDVRLNLYVLFVARYKQYEHGLARLSAIMQYFQGHRVIDQQSTPTFPSGLEKLVLELVTLPFAELNEIWSALRTTYHPSVLYRVRMVTFSVPDLPPGPEILEVVTSVSQ